MKRIACAAVLLALVLAGKAGAEPISFEQAANVSGLTGIQFGVHCDYAYEKIAAGGNTLIAEIENSITQLPVFLRVGLPVMELTLTVPYGNIKDNVEAAQSRNYSGIQNIGLGVKSGLVGLPIFNLAAGLNTRFPTGEPGRYFFGEGLALNPFLAADLDVMLFKLHANVGYEYRGEYNKSFNPFTQDATESVKIKPGDATRYAVGLEIPVSDMFFFVAELNGIQYGEVKIENTSIPDTAGMTLSAVPGIRLEKGIFKMHVGVAIPLEQESERPELAPRSDWRVLAGASVKLGI